MTELEPLYDKKLECLLCKQPFTSKKVRSRFVKIKEVDTDFCPVYESDEVNPLLYPIHVCPACGFSFSDDFSKYFPPGAKESIQTKVTDRWVPRNFGTERTIQQAIQAYKLAIYCGTLKKEKHVLLAGMYLRTAWFYRSLKEEQQELRFLKLAGEEYEQSYMEDDFKGSQVSEVKILYLIGELSRRIKDVDKATKFFSMVIERQKQTVEPKIIEMAKERWHEIRDSRKN
ncbi:DUF2225 domain-containing protein [Neobacillus sp. SM06]|uniref:DUF2225 domain-containing protein n=1 Tax=Neobacillus sp. SM06 TaxID=3422492 RepID=UPI003D268F49